MSHTLSVRAAPAATPGRWAQALTQALDAGLEIFRAADTGDHFVTSDTHLDMLHRTDGETCTCEAAGAGDPVCAHRAALRYALGTLPVVVVPVASLQQSPVSARCPSCEGGRRGIYGAEGFCLDVIDCDQCHGTGRLAPEPSEADSIPALAA